MRSLILLLLALMTNNAYANTSNGKGTITGITVGADFARIKTTNMIEAEDCSEQYWYILDFASDPNNAMYSALLAAQASGQPVRFMLSGCTRNSPKIIHVYLCENSNCG